MVMRTRLLQKINIALKGKFTGFHHKSPPVPIVVINHAASALITWSPGRRRGAPLTHTQQDLCMDNSTTYL